MVSQPGHTKRQWPDVAFTSNPASLQCIIHAISTRCRGTDKVYKKDWTAIPAQICSQLLVPPQHSKLIQVCSSIFSDFTALGTAPTNAVKLTQARPCLDSCAPNCTQSPHPIPTSTGIGAPGQLAVSHQRGLSVRMLHTQLNTALTHPHPTSTDAPTRTCTLARLTSNEALPEQPPPGWSSASHT